MPNTTASKSDQEQHDAAAFTDNAIGTLLTAWGRNGSGGRGLMLCRALKAFEGSSMRNGFPTRSQIWQGAILCTLAEAVRHARRATHFDCYWRGGTHLIDNEQGNFGAVVFAPQRTVAAFFEHESPRSPWAPRDDPAYDWRAFFVGIPSEALSIVEQKLLPEMRSDMQGVTVPTVTAAFWGAGEQLTASEPWEAVYDNGASILFVHLMEPERAIEYLQRNYHFASSQRGLILSLFKKKIANPDGTILLSPEERDVLAEGGEGGIGETRELLAAIRLVMA